MGYTNQGFNRIKHISDSGNLTANPVFSAVDKLPFLKQCSCYLLNRAQKVKNGEELFLYVRYIMTMGM